MVHTNLTEIINKGDPKINSWKDKAAVRKELDGLYNQGVLKRMKRKDVPSGAIKLPSRFVYAIKNANKLEELDKERYTAGGHLDFMKIVMIHNSTNLRHGSITIVSSTAAKHGWIIWGKRCFKSIYPGRGHYAIHCIDTTTRDWATIGRCSKSM